jgi:hypothetical protein
MKRLRNLLDSVSTPNGDVVRISGNTLIGIFKLASFNSQLSLLPSCLVNLIYTGLILRIYS